MASGIAHEWVPFTEDMVICTNCGDTIDEAVSEAEFNAETCVPDELLVGGDS